MNRGNINDPVPDIDNIGDMVRNQLRLAQGDGILDGLIGLGTALIKRNKVVLGDTGIFELSENIQNGILRVIDQIGNDDAVLFNTKYLGVVPNNASGRVSLWADLVKIRQQLLELGAIENFTDTDVTVEQGDNRKSVVVTGSIQVVNAMSKVYMTITVA